MSWLRLHQLLYLLENYLFWEKIKRKLVRIARKEAFEDYYNNNKTAGENGHKPPRNKAVVLEPDGTVIVLTLNEAVKWIIKNYPDAAIEKTNGNSRKIIIIYDGFEPFPDSIAMEIVRI